MGNINLSSGNKCPVCGQTNVDINISGGNDPLHYYCCPNCGCFFAPSDSSIRFGKLKFPFNLNHLKEYLFYHPHGDMRPVICEKSCYDKYITDEYKEVFSITPEMVENWYPRSFAEKVDLILQNSTILQNMMELISKPESLLINCSFAKKQDPPESKKDATTPFSSNI